MYTEYLQNYQILVNFLSSVILITQMILHLLVLQSTQNNWDMLFNGLFCRTTCASGSKNV